MVRAGTVSVKVRAPAPTPPTIHYFHGVAVDRADGRKRHIARLDVSEATSVVIDRAIGTVPLSGSTVVTPDETTTYILTATGSGSAVATASVTITLDPPHVVILAPGTDLSGYVRFSGYGPYGEVYVGDDEADRGLRGFLTYFITGIPEDATIARVIVHMSGYDTPYDNPFPGLGCLSAFEHPYNSLQGQYRVPGLPGVLEQWCSVSELALPRESVGIRDALQARLGDDKFQLRLQFAGMESDGDDTRDFLCWRAGNLPTLTVEYYTSTH